MTMNETGQESREERMARIRRTNRRTATWVGGLALFFFVMLFVNRLWLH
jgi:hypothetical protein